MNKTVLLLLFVLLISMTLAVSITGNHAIDVIAQAQLQPETATDIIMRSRSQPAVEPKGRSNTGWLGAGLFGLVLVVVGLSIFVMRGGTDLLKQWRLARKQQAQSGRPYVPTLRPVPTLRQVPRMPQERPLLGEWSDTDDAPTFNTN